MPTVIFGTLEEFCKAHQFTIAALSALATFGAVLVSLAFGFFTLRSTRTRIKSTVAFSVVLHETLRGKPKPTYLTADIRNLGVMPVTIPLSFFRWKLPFDRGTYMVNPWDYLSHDVWVSQKQYPFEIKPRAAQTFFIADTERFHTELLKMFEQGGFLKRLQYRYMRVCIITGDGTIFRAKLDRKVRHELHQLIKASSKKA
ncbi:MAG: hypothetical protein ACM3W7_12490 [Acidobacteriota bacterium]